MHLPATRDDFRIAPPLTACQYVIFDLDGTLVDSVPGIEYSTDKAVAAVLPGTVAPRLRDHIGPPIRQMYQRLFPGLDPPTLVRLEQEFRRSYDGDGWSHTVAFAGAEQTLQHLAQLGVRCFLATNKPLGPTLKILDLLSLSPHLEAVAAPDAVSPRFTSKAEMVRWLIATRNLTGRTGLLVGDAADDRRAADECGLNFAAALYGYGTAGLQTTSRPPIELNKIGDLAGYFPAVSAIDP